jgi:hypothetical protein
MEIIVIILKKEFVSIFLTVDLTASQTSSKATSTSPILNPNTFVLEIPLNQTFRYNLGGFGILEF